MTGIASPPEVRIALYSHDGMGLGHVRRNLLIAQSLLARRSGSDVLLIAGAHEASVLATEAGIDCLTVPRISKQPDGDYAPRSMNLDLGDLVHLRSQTIAASLRAYHPDLFIVDKKARGVMGELDPVLRFLRDAGRTKIVLGLRDVLDDPEAVAREWIGEDYCGAIDEFYDAVWVYGDRTVYDLGVEAGLPESIRLRLEYTGYLDQQVRLTHSGKSARDLLAETGVKENPFALCLVGGGEDGMQLIENFARAELPPGMHGVAVTGPFMPAGFRRSLYELAAARPRLHVLDFVHEPTKLIAAAERVISMGGYGALTEVLSLEKPALIVPRIRLRKEQQIRARRFAEMGLVDCLLPDQLTPEALATWLREDTQTGKGARKRIDLGGLERLPAMAGALLRDAAAGQGSAEGLLQPLPAAVGGEQRSEPGILPILAPADRV